MCSGGLLFDGGGGLDFGTGIREICGLGIGIQLGRISILFFFGLVFAFVIALGFTICFAFDSFTVVSCIISIAIRIESISL